MSEHTSRRERMTRTKVQASPVHWNSSSRREVLEKTTRYSPRADIYDGRDRQSQSIYNFWDMVSTTFWRRGSRRTSDTIQGVQAQKWGDSCANQTTCDWLRDESQNHELWKGAAPRLIEAFNLHSRLTNGTSEDYSQEYNSTTNEAILCLRVAQFREALDGTTYTTPPLLQILLHNKEKWW